MGVGIITVAIAVVMACIAFYAWTLDSGQWA